MQVLVDQLPGFCVYVDARRIILAHNHALSGWLAPDHRELVGLPLADILGHGAGTAEILGLVDLALGGTTLTSEIELQLAVGAERRFQCQLTPHAGDDENVLGCVLQLNDATAAVAGRRLARHEVVRKQALQAQIEHLTGQVSSLRDDRVRAFRNLAGGLAHELNNLMTVMVGDLEMARARLSREDEAYRHLKRLEAAVDEADQITQLLLAASGKPRLDVATIRLDSFLEEATAELLTVCKPTLRLVVESSDPAPSIGADVDYLQLALECLVRCADGAFAGSAAPIRLRASVRTLDGDAVAALGESFPLPPGQYGCVEVHAPPASWEDCTVGEPLDPVFAPRFRERSLRLAAVQGIMSAHQGTSFLADVGGGELVVELYFPLWRSSARPREPIAS